MEQKCFHCEKPIVGLDYKLVAFDKPYVNLFFHKECFKLLPENIDTYVEENIDKFMRFCSIFRKK